MNEAEKAKRVIFESGARYECSKCGRVIKRLGPYRQHVAKCKGPKKTVRLCDNCGQKIGLRSYGGHRALCLGRNRLSDPEVHRRAMAKRSKNMEYRAYLSNRMKGNRNPAKSEQVRKKLIESWKGPQTRIPYGRGVGGKGRASTTSENEAVAALTSLGFLSEYKILTGAKKGQGLATWYSLDLAHPEKKIALEIDGSSHQGRQEIDRRKNEFLISRGWVVVRIPATCVRQGCVWVREEFFRFNELSPQVISFSIWK